MFSRKKYQTTFDKVHTSVNSRNTPIFLYFLQSITQTSLLSNICCCVVKQAVNAQNRYLQVTLMFESFISHWRCFPLSCGLQNLGRGKLQRGFVDVVSTRRLIYPDFVSRKGSTSFLLETSSHQISNIVFFQGRIFFKAGLQLVFSFSLLPFHHNCQ